MKAILTGAVLALALTTAGAAEDGASANAMLLTCKAAASDKPQAVNAAAASYCNGMLDMLAFMASYLNDRPWLCMDFPKGVTGQEAAKVVVRYAETHAEHMHEPLMWLAVLALHDAWPCLSTDFDQRFNGK
jgi:Rap1a immunity proteins